ncbi:MAG: DNA polymerase III subunit delta [Pseudomonadota bacterium]
MVALKAPQVASFVKRPSSEVSALLIYGTDAGLVSERARAVAEAYAAQSTPPGEIIRVDESDLETDPDRLSVELMTVAMFGGRRIVRVSTGRRINAAMLKAVVAAAPLAGVLIVEAGSLKADDTLRTTFEKSPHTAALPCFPDEAQGLADLAQEVLGAAGLAITPEARELLLARLGADRALSRAELEKLVLYAQGKETVEADDVEAIVGDSSELAIDRILAAAAIGDAAGAVTALSRAIAAGESAQGIILASQRHLQRLHRLRAELDRGRSFEDAVRHMRPPLHFKQKDALSRQCRTWTGERIGQGLEAAARAAREARLAGALEEPIAERLVIKIAFLARQGAAKGRPRYS